MINFRRIRVAGPVAGAALLVAVGALPASAAPADQPAPPPVDQGLLTTLVGVHPAPAVPPEGAPPPNALPPVLTVLGIQIGQLLGGAIIVETIFAWPGIGQLLLQAVTGRDYLLTQDLLLIAVVVFIVVQIVTDVVDAAMDPRIRMEHA